VDGDQSKPRKWESSCLPVRDSRNFPGPCRQESRKTGHSGLEKVSFLIVSCSIPDAVFDFFNLPDPSNRTKALGSTQPLTKMSSRNHPWG
jgi:hypothetical protein